MRLIACMTLAGALALAGCGRREPEEAPETNSVVEEPANIATPPPPSPPAENAAENKTAPAPPPKFSDDEQMRDDADATGLTARLAEGGEEASGQPDNQTSPAQ